MWDHEYSAEEAQQLLSEVRHKHGEETPQGRYERERWEAGLPLERHVVAVAEEPHIGGYTRSIRSRRG